MNEQPILSVTEISLSLKACVEQIFNHVRVRGEVSDVKRATSGHIYFTLKDKDSVLSAVCWRGRAPATNQALQAGLEIICTGKLSTYPGRSNYQMIVESAEPAGVGALLKLLNERKEKLEKEGLFDARHKKPIPYLPETIGVITSPTGAVIRDIIHRLTDRFPRHVLVWPVAVQGEECAPQVAAAIRGFNQLPAQFPKPDVLIVARGGGSLEDLWGFNEEEVVCAAFESKIPLISAVGHETDTTLIDYVADLRAPTPTGAAEKAVPMRLELLEKMGTISLRLDHALNRTIQEKGLKLKSACHQLPNLQEMIHQFTQRLDDKTEQLIHTMHHFLTFQAEKLKSLSQLLDSYSYQGVLKRGFSLAQEPGGKMITSAQSAQQVHQINIVFYDGKVETIPLKRNKILKTDTDNNQGDLFKV